MQVEVLIYAYLAVCAAMIGFNIICIFVFRHKDKKLDDYSGTFTDKVREQIELPEIDAAHRKCLGKELKNVNNLMAFDKTLGELYTQHPEKIQNYIEALSAVFVHLTDEYMKKDKMQAAYFPYIIKKYHVFRGQNIETVTKAMLELVHESNLYCRENAMQALYSIGNGDAVVKALRILDEGEYYHHPKLITDGLLEFTGDKAELDHMLWTKLPGFSEKMLVAILDYFRFSTGDYCEQMLRLLLSGNRTDEVGYSCIRYFGKYVYEPAFPYLLDFAEMADEKHWEYTAIAATALANYPSEKTTETLKELLHSHNWYVRFNASQSLAQLGLDYVDLIDIFEGDDRYAGEIMRYRFDQKRMKEKEAASI